MNLKKQIKLKHWWRELLVLVVCLLAGINVNASVHFKDAGMMSIIHSPSISQPYIIVDVLYFDAYGGDGYFTTSADHSGDPGAAVYVNGEYICSPSELTWDGNQSGANNWRDKNSWAGKTYNTDKAVVRFYDPRHEAESGAAEDRYRVYMYIFLKNWKAGEKYTVKVGGYWKRNAKGSDPGSGGWEYQEKTTSAFSDPWTTTPTAIMTDYNHVSVSGDLSTSYGSTTVGIYTKSSTAPSDFIATTANQLEKYSSYTKGTSSFSNMETSFSIAGSSSDTYKSPRKLPVQYSFTIQNDNCIDDNKQKVTMTVYKWFNCSVGGFAYPSSVSFQKSDQWKRKVSISWNAVTSGRSTQGTWTIVNVTDNNTKLVENISASTTSKVVTLPDYETNDIRVYFVPKNMTIENLRTELSAKVSAKVNTEWSFGEVSASEIEEDCADKGKIKISWNFAALGDASSSKKYQFEIYRSTDQENYTKLTPNSENPIPVVEDETTTDCSWVDKEVESSHTYFYKVKVNVFGSDVSSNVAQARSGGSKIRSFTATRGSYSNMVKLQWTINLVGKSANFIIQRRPLGSDEERDWADIYTVSGSATSYSYDDVTALPGSFNDYRIIIWSEEEVNKVSVWTQDDAKTTDGFSISTGIISGNVSYGTGTAVEGTKVTLKQQSGGNTASGMHALVLSGAGSGLKYAADLTAIESLLEGNFSAQMYVSPNKEIMSTDNGTYQLLYVKDALDIKIKYNEAGENYTLAGTIGDASIASTLALPAGVWSQLSLVYSKSSKTLTAYLVKNDEIESEVVATLTGSLAPTGTNLVIGNTDNFGYANYYGGMLDEFRFWNRALTEQEILRNYNHPMAGNEVDLAIYYPLDEGLSSQKIAYDYSRKNGISNGRHATLKTPAESSEDVPSENQLSLMAYTDSLGYYEIRGVPFMGEGTSYVVIPTMGIHEFSPAKQSRYISMSTLNHSAVDFEDVSSFPVSGRVFYDKTDYPVEGVNFYIDGNICSKDGDVISTNSEGEFTISVPIGDHFIMVKKNGHVFADFGRYPADPNDVGTRMTFNREIKNLEFVDQTLVNFSGRVVGGNIQGDNAVGFGLSKNNIGVAELVLTPFNPNYRMNVVKVVSGTTYSYETNDADEPLASATDKINSRSWRGSASSSGGDDFKKLFIQTDATTGEFSAMVPPLQYSIGNITIVKGTKELDGSSTTVDLTNPSVEYSDTLFHDDGTYDLYYYNTMLNYVYHTDNPTFIVTQEDDIHGKGSTNDKAFGIKSYLAGDGKDKIQVNDIYSIENGVPVYKYGKENNTTNGSAVFIMNDRYTFNIEAYEEYVNRDGTQPVVDHVPLSGIKVTIDNALSDEQPIYTETDPSVPEAIAGEVYELQSNQLKLDDEGKAVYSWLAGLPNVTSPYFRTITITYDIDGRTYSWSESGMHGVILGSIPTGNNFVTNGPDMVDMVLRDPPGSKSYSEWTSGTIKSTSNAALATFNSNTSLKASAHLGTKITTASGIGVAVINQIEAKQNWDAGISAKVEFEGGGTWSTTTEVTKTISTSDDEDYVGAQGDVFVGKATNVLFGKARNVDFHRINAGSNEVELRVDDVIATGLSFGTLFSYTQKYIEEELIPHLKDLRNSLLKDATPSEISSATNDGTKPVYLTTISRTDERFGSNNSDKSAWGALATAGMCSAGPSYTMVVPTSASADDIFQDDVMYYNTQIETWEQYLALNEKEKVEAYENRNDKDVVKSYKNYSFDSGSKVTNSVETQESTGHKIQIHGEVGILVGTQVGAEVDGNGVSVDFSSETGIGYKHENEENNTDKTSFSFTLAESGSDDALTVDVYEYGSFGPIFRTLGGQTSAPYEGKEVTKYYLPGTTIMEATMQIEVPKIGVDVSDISDVPTGSAANFVLRLSNASEVNKDVTYKLFLLDKTNATGAQISVDGQVLTDGRLINVPGGQTITKALQIRQTDMSKLNFEKIGIVFASTSQPGDINDVVYLSAHFTPSSSPVSLVMNKRLMNTSNGTNLVLTFKDFDRNYTNLKAFRIQYKKQGATDWTLLKEYVLNSADKTTNNEMLPSQGAEVAYELPMAAFSDGEYSFRVESASTNGLSEVHRYSDELTLTKDMQRPTPLGQPEPSNGILNIGDDLSVTFNETILKGELTKVANFKVTGVLNGAPVAHWTALSMQNTSAAASTEASINLAGKDFSFDAWVNLSTGAGTLLSHGNGTARFAVGVDADEKLVVNIAGNTYTSTATVPTGKWVFLTLSFKNTATGCVLNASVAADDATTNLFIDQAVVKYNGNGPLAVGLNLTGAIHELLLWDEAHDLTTALLNRGITKSPSTRHLIGYWKMDEGEGTSIRDYSRNRHMVMSDATWYLNNANKSIALDGEHYMSIDASQLPVCVDDDYAVEFWMRGAKQSNDQQLMQMGEISLWVDADGNLQLTGKGAYNDAVAQTIATNATGLTDNAWHHIAVNVLRQGATAVYVDGVRCLTTNSDNVGSITTNNLIIGARRVTESAESGTYSYNRPFTGQIDEVRVWNATMNSEMLLKNRKVRLTGTEDGLIAYYPFETQTLDQGNQVISVSSADDLTSNLSAKFFATSNSATATMAFSDEAPAMRQKPSETNVSFTFVASNEKIVINIDEDPATIEGCTLNFTVRDVRDENGNYSVPAVWSAFINQKELNWDEDELSVEQQVKDESSVTATIVNKSGTQQMWTLSGMPAWLTASSEYGTTNPLAQSKVTFTVSPATPIGKYQETIYLKSNNGIETPLVLNVTVTGDVPDWSVNYNDYEFSMNVIARAEILNIPVDDEDDIVAAFIGEECRGVAHPVYSARYDSYYVTMDIYDNDSNPKDVTFRIYDASTGTLYPEVKTTLSNAAETISFEPLALKGSYATPYVLNALDKMEQTINLKAGWNWISFNVKADNMTVSSIFNNIAEDVVIVKSQINGYQMYENGNWTGFINGGLVNSEMYAVKMKADRQLRIVGTRIKPSEEPITVYDGWNWIGYYGRQVASVTDAMADIQPENGDILKGQNGVTYYDGGEWAGSLIMMEPGVGYVMFSSNVNDRTFGYPSSALAPSRAQNRANDAAYQYTFNSVDFRRYSSNAIITAKVMNGNVPMANVEIGVFAGDECRMTAITDENGIAYITVPGDDPTLLNFKVAQNGVITDIIETIVYENNAIFGTPTDPFELSMGTTGVMDIISGDGEGSIYDLQGRKIDETLAPSGLNKGIFIINGQKKAIR